VGFLPPRSRRDERQIFQVPSCHPTNSVDAVKGTQGIEPKQEDHPLSLSLSSSVTIILREGALSFDLPSDASPFKSQGSVTKYPQRHIRCFCSASRFFSMLNTGWQRQ